MESDTGVDNHKFNTIWRKLNRNQRRFVVAMPEYSSKKKCAKELDIPAATVYNWPEYMNDAIELYQEHIADAATNILVDGISKAALVKVAGLDSEDERIKQMSATEILDRYFGKPKQRTEHTGDEGGPLTVKLVTLGGIDPDKDI